MASIRVSSADVANMEAQLEALKLRKQIQDQAEVEAREIARQNLEVIQEPRAMDPLQSEDDIAFSSKAAPELAYLPGAASSNILRRAHFAPGWQYKMLPLQDGLCFTPYGLEERISNGEFAKLIFTGHGFNHEASFGFSFQATEKLPAELTITFRAGHIFIPANHGRTQNHILRDDLVVTLKPGEKQEGRVYSFCGNDNFGCSTGGLELIPTMCAMNVGTLSGQHPLWCWLSNYKSSTRRWIGEDGEMTECDEITDKEVENGRAMEELASTCPDELNASIQMQKKLAATDVMCEALERRKDLIRENAAGHLLKNNAKVLKSAWKLLEKELGSDDNDDHEGGEGEMKSGQSSDAMVRRILFCYFFIYSFFLLNFI